MPALDGTTHLLLTVIDVDRSTRWYREVFGMVVLDDESSTPELAAQGYRAALLLQPESLLVVGLIQHPDNDGAPFHERRTGLDHFGVHVAARSDLDEWISHLEALGVAHEPVATADYGEVVVFRDPDNIQLEIAHANAAYYEARVLRAIEGTPPRGLGRDADPELTDVYAPRPSRWEGL